MQQDCIIERWTRIRLSVWMDHQLSYFFLESTVIFPELYRTFPSENFFVYSFELTVQASSSHFTGCRRRNSENELWLRKTITLVERISQAAITAIRLVSAPVCCTRMLPAEFNVFSKSRKMIGGFVALQGIQKLSA